MEIFLRKPLGKRSFSEVKSLFVLEEDNSFAERKRRRGKFDKNK
jgi:hypothetical protein